MKSLADRVVWFKSFDLSHCFKSPKKSLIYMNLTQIIFYKHRDQQSFVYFFNTKVQCMYTCVVVLSPDSLSKSEALS